MRFFKRAICVLTAAAFLAAGIPVFSYAEDTATPEVILASLSTQEKIEQMLMPAFRYVTGEDGKKQGMTELTEEAAAAIEKHGFAGVILFAQNTGNTEKAVKFIQDMQSANANHPTQLLVGIDQEGGYVTRLGQGTQTAGNMALGASGDSALAEETGRIIGSELKSMGINFDFAPVVDVNSNPANPVIGTRSFSDDATLAASLGTAFMKGLQEEGIISTLKHFPGHGDTATDSHTGLPRIDRSLEELKARELVPFQAAIDAGVEAIMTAHIQYPQIETESYLSKLTGEEITLPATLSETIITDLLRGDMGFDGVVITDAMNMDAIAKHFDRFDAAKLAIEAGVDILLMPVDTSTPEGMADLDAYIDTLAGMVESGGIDAAKVDAAVLRILTLKAAHGLTEAYSGIDPAASAVVGSAAHHETEWEIAKKTITVVKNDHNMLPMRGENESITVLTAYDDEVLSMEYGADLLAEEGKLAEGMTVSVHSIQNLTAEEAIALTAEADHVVIISEIYSASWLVNDYSKKADAIIESVHADGKDVAVLSCHLPYDAARYQAADAIVLAWSARSMSEDPRKTEGPVAQYGPNLSAAMYLMLSEESPVGTLPVDIPKLDGQGQYTAEILYRRGFGLQYGMAGNFTDVSRNAWYADGVVYAATNGIMAGMGDGVFAPQSSVTRAQMAAMLWSMSGGPVVNYAMSFEDVEAGSWYEEAVRWAVSENIAAGYSEKAFGPNDAVTREQAALMLKQFAKAETPDGVMGLAGYTDYLQISAWAHDAMLWAVYEDLLGGSGGYLMPQKTMTRAEAAVILRNFHQSFVAFP